MNNCTDVKRVLLFKCKKSHGSYFVQMDDEWFKRLVAEIDAHPDSRRAISLRAGFSDTYLHQMITYEKHPSVSRFIAICDAIGKDPVEILTGVKSNAETAKAVQMFAAMPPDQRKAFLAMLATVRPGNAEDQKERDPHPAD
jgi:lambda repressor-like predicted transcriptional regulator